MNKFPKVYIIIVNTNGGKHIFECLNSLQRIDYSNYSVVVVDNNSSDGSPKKIKQEYPEVTLFRNGDNLGFAGANNRGIEYAMEQNGDYVLLLNDDTVVAIDFLTELIKVAESNPKIGIVGAKNYYYDFNRRKDIIWYAGAKINWWTGSPTHIGNKQKDSEKYSGIYETIYAAGSCFLIKKDVVKKIGLLDNTYFIYYEEADYSIKAQKAGFKVIYNGKSKIWHKVGASTDTKSLSSRSPFSLYYGVRNRTIFMKKNCPHFYNLFFFIIFQIIFRGFVSPIYFLIKEKDFKLVKTCLKGLWDGLLYSPKST